MAKTRTPSVWVLSRVVSDGDGDTYKQNVSVYAGSAREAVALVGAEFARLARITGKAEAPYRESPAWSVEEVRLDDPKVITMGLTG
jgi:hypothetical protein